MNNYLLWTYFMIIGHILAGCGYGA